MSDFSIGISGIYAAHNAMSVIGNNISNVATEGYHRQKVNLRPNDPAFEGNLSVGQGVTTLEARRLVDRFLEESILKQHASTTQYTRELSVLKSIENSFGDMTGTGLSNTITKFYNSLNQLASDPQNSVEQNSVSNQAAVLASQFNTIGVFLTELEDQIYLEANNIVEEINLLSDSVAEMNYNIQELGIKGAEGSNLRDKRDQAITEISKLIGVTTQPVDDTGMVNVFVSGFPIVMGTNSTNLELSPVTSSSMGLSPEGVKNFSTEITGGTLGGLINIKNNYIGTIKKQFDDLAVDIITSMNKYHVQGVPSYNVDTGAGGSFKSLDGWPLNVSDLSDFNPPISNGTINVRVTDTTTGVIRRHSINVDPATDTMTTMAAKLDAIDGLSSSVNNTYLHIEADANYKFDFLASPLPKSAPTIFSSALSGTSTVSAGGIYTGNINQNYTMAIVGNATVGTSAFDVEVRDGTGSLVDTVTVGAGYVPSDKLTTVNGVEFSFDAGTVINGETFTVAALNSPTVSGVYTGSTDETYTCTVVGSGKIGVTDGLSLRIENSSGGLVNTINIGSGYGATKPFLFDSSQKSLYLKMESGPVIDGQTFDIVALADSDTSDFLASAGINSFFNGHDAASISVSSTIRDAPSKISVSMGTDMNDNENIMRISQISDKTIEGLGYETHESYYRKIVTGLAQKVNVTTMNQENSQRIMSELKSQRDRVSGVDINTEAAELMIYEQMFQSMAKYMNLIKETMEEIMNIL